MQAHTHTFTHICMWWWGGVQRPRPRARWRLRWRLYSHQWPCWTSMLNKQNHEALNVVSLSRIGLWALLIPGAYWGFQGPIQESPCSRWFRLKHMAYGLYWHLTSTWEEAKHPHILKHANLGEIRTFLINEQKARKLAVSNLWGELNVLHL